MEESSVPVVTAGSLSRCLPRREEDSTRVQDPSVPVSIEGADLTVGLEEGGLAGGDFFFCFCLDVEAGGTGIADSAEETTTDSAGVMVVPVAFLPFAFFFFDFLGWTCEEGSSDATDSASNCPGRTAGAPTTLRAAFSPSTVEVGSADADAFFFFFPFFEAGVEGPAPCATLGCDTWE